MTDFRIGLIDSNVPVRAGRAMIFNAQPDMKVVLEEADPLSALQRCSDYLVDVLVVGPSQHRLRGSQFIETLCKSLQAASNDCVVLAYSSFYSNALRFDAVRSGAQEFLGLDNDANQFLSTIRNIIKRDFTIPMSELAEMATQNPLVRISGPLELLLSDLPIGQQNLLDEFLLGRMDQEIAKKFDMARTRVTKFIDGLVVSGGFTSRNQLALSLLGARK